MKLLLPSIGIEWLDVVDAELASIIIRSFPSSPEVLEVGVWKGAWSVTVLLNTTAKVTGIDPYPAGEDAKTALFRSLNDNDLGGRFVLESSWEALAPDKKFDLIHVDALHTEAALEADLINADERLSGGGVIIVDDFRHPWFPGASSAFYRFLDAKGYLILCTSSNKAYVCRASSHSNLRGQFIELMKNPISFIVFDYLTDERPNQLYVSPTDVRGAPVLLIEKLSWLAPLKHKVYNLLPGWIRQKL
ncbi:hypothetical protein GM51_2910 [freshwater metagenome]|uniref:Methyltransferase domain-containing protein n=1 Tax=freshwater metagenome TaxID=449393 RepID=A0A094QG19_9ZZZZ